MTTESQAQSGALELPKDAGGGARGRVKRWCMEIELAGNAEKYWRKQALDASDRFRDQSTRNGEIRRYQSDDGAGSNKFNILYSNTETIVPALYNEEPKPDIRRRFRDEDPIGKQVAETLERAAALQMEGGNFHRFMRLAVRDRTLVGRGITRVRFRPTMQQKIDPMTNSPFEALVDASVVYEHVPWKHFRRGPGRAWEEISWIAFEHFVTRRKLQKEFGAAAKHVEMDYSPEGVGEEDDPDIEDTFKRARIWEIWDKDTRKVLWIAPSYMEKPLREDDDPLRLEQFFCVPRPLYAVETTDDLCPIEPFRFYREQATELDEITRRIGVIIKACKARGIYDGELGSEISRLAEESDSVLIPAENITALVSNGGLDRAIWMWPVDKIAGVLAHLYGQRESIKQTIYEITGIADIMRGASDAQETLGAQRLKAQFGTMRIDDARQDVQRYARDLVRLTVEIIAEHFTPELVSMMTARQVTPDMVAVMQQDGARGFTIDVETDQTISGDIQQDQENMTRLLEGIAGYVSAIGPTVEAGYIPQDAAMTLLMTAVRRFKLGREVEDALQQAGEQRAPQQHGADTQAMAAQADIEARQAGMAIQQQESQAKLALEQQKMASEAAMAREEMVARIEIARMEAQERLALAREKQAADIELARAKAVDDAQTRRVQASQRAAS